MNKKIYALVIVLLSFVSVSIAQNTRSLEEDVLTVIGGSFGADHQGPDVFKDISDRVSTNSLAANQIVVDKILTPGFSGKEISKWHIDALLPLTAPGDSVGATNIALQIESALDEELKAYDDAVDKQEFMRTLNETDQWQIDRMRILRRTFAYLPSTF